VGYRLREDVVSPEVRRGVVGKRQMGPYTKKCGICEASMYTSAANYNIPRS
jgi:hypothetical protein